MQYLKFMLTLLLAVNISSALAETAPKFWPNTSNSSQYIHTTQFKLQDSKKSLALTARLFLGYEKNGKCTELFKMAEMMDDYQNNDTLSLNQMKIVSDKPYTCVQEEYITETGFTNSLSYQLLNDGVFYNKATPTRQQLNLK